MATLLCELRRMCHAPAGPVKWPRAWRRARGLLGSGRHGDRDRAERAGHQAGGLARLPGRRPGLGRRDHRLHRPHEGAPRHQHRGRERPGPAPHPRHRRGAAPDPLAQGARGQRAHAGEPRGPARPPAPGRGRRRPRDLRRVHPEQAARDHVLEVRRRGRAPLHLRRALRLHLARDGRLRRQHRDDPRSAGPGEAEGSGALVDAGAVDRGWREAGVVGAPSSLPPPDPRGQPALRELLARRLRDPRHRGHEQAPLRLRARLEPALHHADPHRAAAAVPAPRPPDHAGRRRGRGQDRPGAAVVPLAGGHHRRAPPGADLDLPGARE